MTTPSPGTEADKVYRQSTINYWGFKPFPGAIQSDYDKLMFRSRGVYVPRKTDPPELLQSYYELYEVPLMRQRGMSEAQIAKRRSPRDSSYRSHDWTAYDAGLTPGVNDMQYVSKTRPDGKVVRTRGGEVKPSWTPRSAEAPQQNESQSTGTGTSSPPPPPATQQPSQTQDSSVNPQVSVNQPPPPRPVFGSPLGSSNDAPRRTYSSDANVTHKEPVDNGHAAADYRRPLFAGPAASSTDWFNDLSNRGIGRGDVPGGAGGSARPVGGTPPPSSGEGYVPGGAVPAGTPEPLVVSAPGVGGYTGGPDGYNVNRAAGAGTQESTGDGGGTTSLASFFGEGAITPQQSWGLVQEVPFDVDSMLNDMKADGQLTGVQISKLAELGIDIAQDGFFGWKGTTLKTVISTLTGVPLLGSVLKWIVSKIIDKKFWSKYALQNPAENLPPSSGQAAINAGLASGGAGGDPGGGPSGGGYDPGGGGGGYGGRIDVGGGYTGVTGVQGGGQYEYTGGPAGAGPFRSYLKN